MASMFTVTRIAFLSGDAQQRLPSTTASAILAPFSPS